MADDRPKEELAVEIADINSVHIDDMDIAARLSLSIDRQPSKGGEHAV
jgi:hypothetical protein